MLNTRYNDASLPRNCFHQAPWGGRHALSIYVYTYRHIKMKITRKWFPLKSERGSFPIFFIQPSPPFIFAFLLFLSFRSKNNFWCGNSWNDWKDGIVVLCPYYGRLRGHVQTIFGKINVIMTLRGGIACDANFCVLLSFCQLFLQDFAAIMPII